VGLCRGGGQSCESAKWSACEKEVTPSIDTCNGDDDDCDGLADEGALSPCGGCDAACKGGVWGPPNTPFEATEELDVTAVGQLTLLRHELESLTVWVPNTGEGTLSKVDAISARELSRYSVSGETPERVAVDYHGDAWVLSPSLDGVSMLTKVAADDVRCVDRNGDGKLQTSRGPDDVLAQSEDECVLLTVPVGETGDVARTLATDGLRGPDGAGGGEIWIGLQARQRMLQLNGETGAIERDIATPGLSPYAAIFDPWGTLWVIGREGVLGRLRPAAEPTEVEVVEAPLRCYTFEALASDAQGVLTLTGSACEQVTLYDPARDRWQHVKTEGVLDARGVAVLGEDSWVSQTGGSVSRVSRNPLLFKETVALQAQGYSPIESIAVGGDSHGQLWVVSSMGSPDDSGVLTRFDPVAGEVTAQVPLGRLPRGQGDITGDRRLGEFAPEASATHIFDGCAGAQSDAGTLRPGRATDWERLHLSWIGGEGASVLVEARWATDRGGLQDASWVMLGQVPDDEPPYDVPFDTGGVVEVRLTLRVAGSIGAPRIARVGLQWQCAGPD
jgi:streptogramin lyase